MVEQKQPPINGTKDQATPSLNAETKGANREIPVSPWLEPLSSQEQKQLRTTAPNAIPEPDSEWPEAQRSPGWLEYTGIAKAVAVFAAAFVALQAGLMVASAWSYHWSLGCAAAVIMGVPGCWISARLWRARRNGQRVEHLTQLRLQADQLMASDAAVGFARYAQQVTQNLPALTPLFDGQSDRLGVYANDREKLLDIDRQLMLRCDQAARREVVRTTRRTALGVAASPFLALDLFIAIAGNLSLIGRVAKAYGLPPSPFLEARLLVHVYRQIALIGSIEVGTELAGEFFSRAMLARLSGRMAQGFSAGLYTYRIGVTAMQLCRPLTFTEASRPKGGGLFQDIFKRLEADDLAD